MSATGAPRAVGRGAGGGRAEVWRARVKGVAGFERRIVIKTMLTALQHRQELVQMFVAEAAIAGRLSHPNIVHVFDFGQLEGRYFIAMEYVPGVTLRFAHKRRKRTRPLHHPVHRDAAEQRLAGALKHRLRLRPFIHIALLLALHQRLKTTAVNGCHGMGSSLSNRQTR